MAKIHLLPQRWLIFIALNAVYFFVYFHRISTAVLAPYLIEAFSASATGLGVMSSAYFYPYALSQPIVGMAADRWGPRKVITLSTLIGFGGALIFGLAPTLFMASIARALIGLGAAGIFVPALKLLLPWFGSRSFARMNAVLLAVGNVAAIVASTPFAWFIQQIGWRFSFFFIAGVTLLLAILCWVYLQDLPPGSPSPPEGMGKNPTAPKTTFGDILRNPFFWTIFALFFTYGAPFSTFQGLWGYPFLIDVFRYDKLQASNLLMVIAFGVILGGPFLSYLGDKPFAGRKQTLLSICIAAQVLNWSCIVFGGPSLGSFTLSIIFFAMGTSLAGTLSLVWAIIREVAPPDRLGTAMGLINPAPFLGVALFQPATGYLMDRVGKVSGTFPFEAYRSAFGLCLISVSVAFIISLLVKKRKWG